ncbi:D-amino-acid dehydrogenase [Palleronia aestuarii]|uniref:D-amino-acid dehydrogenase n=2 Tax=Palleronia aestuarii TaxID=568105 RepID=A0A2W7NHC9_9RHOB|nr:D-amino-acid dehydrogenase [Palleronia aestuarii]
MVGVATALALQARGHDCLLLDRRAPGEETSYGNAGLIQAEAAEPYALPWRVWDLARMAVGYRNAVALDPRALPGQAGALLRYWWQSRPASHARISRTYARLIAEAVPTHAPLIAEAGADNIIHRDGYWDAYRTPGAFDAALQEAERMRERHDCAFTPHDGDALGRAEPALERRLAGAILWSETWRCSAPGELVAAYARLFVARGGTIATGDAMSLEQVGKGWRAAGQEAERAVVALGPWSPELLARFGYRVPMVRKRGHHLHFAGTHGLRRALVDAENSTVLAPMRQGLRVATGAAFSTSAPAALPRQLRRGEVTARELLPIGEAVEPAAWSGTRPCLPGMLPLVREAPRHPGLWLHFGHGHHGFTLGPATAERLARAMEGEAEAVARLDGGLLGH